MGEEHAPVVSVHDSSSCGGLYGMRETRRGDFGWASMGVRFSPYRRHGNCDVRVILVTVST